MSNLHSHAGSEQTSDRLPDSFVVSEGHYSAASAHERAGLVTFGLWICTAVTIHNPATQYGLMAHVTATSDPEASFASILGGYEDDLAASDIKITGNPGIVPEHRRHASTIDFDKWPSPDFVHKYFSGRGSRTISQVVPTGIDRSRTVVLDLATGSVTRPRVEKIGYRESDLSRNQRITGTIDKRADLLK